MVGGVVAQGPALFHYLRLRDQFPPPYKERLAGGAGIEWMRGRGSEEVDKNPDVWWHTATGRWEHGHMCALSGRSEYSSWAGLQFWENEVTWLVKNWKELNCRWMGAQMNRLQSLQTVEYYAAMKRNKPQIHAVTWVTLSHAEQKQPAAVLQEGLSHFSGARSGGRWLSAPRELLQMMNIFISRSW